MKALLYSKFQICHFNLCQRSFFYETRSQFNVDTDQWWIFFLWWKLRPNCSMVSPWHLIKTEPRLVCLKSRNWYCGSQGRPVDHKWHDLIWDFSRQNVAKASKLISIIFVWFLYFWEHLTYCDWALMDEIRPDENLSENHKN